MGNRVWLVLIGLAIALTVACSSSTTPSDGGSDDGAPGTTSGG